MLDELVPYVQCMLGGFGDGTCIWLWGGLLERSAMQCLTFMNGMEGVSFSCITVDLIG